MWSRCQGILKHHEEYVQVATRALQVLNAVRHRLQSATPTGIRDQEPSSARNHDTIMESAGSNYSQHPSVPGDSLDMNIDLDRIDTSWFTHNLDIDWLDLPPFTE